MNTNAEYGNPFARRKFLSFNSGTFLFVLGMFFTLAAFAIAKKGLMPGLALIAIPILFGALRMIFLNPVYGFLFVFIMNYFALGLTRYLPAPLGLTIDFLLVLTYLALFARFFYKKIDWSKARYDLTFLAILWYLYALFQLVNPEAHSRVAWFYAMRGVALYMLLVIPLAFMLLDRIKYLRYFLLLWGIFSLLATTKGLIQLYVGLDPWEQAWLDGGGYVTHLLFGKLRIFSFFSDAGQFGGHQGHTGIVFSILAFYEKDKKRKLFYAAVGLLALYGMFISGTRGAIAVPFGAGLLFLIHSKNLKIIIPGVVLGLLIFGFFKFTTIGNQNYEIRRMRTAFDKDNPSLQVRLENQKKLKVFLASRSFGGGIGSAGNWGQRFSPGTFLAETPTDSWYVMIWAEQGIAGLMLHLFILFYVIIKGSFLIMFRLKVTELKIIMSALLSGIFGVMIAAYGNGILGQMPTGIIVYLSMAFVFMSPKLEKEWLDMNPGYLKQEKL